MEGEPGKTEVDDRSVGLEDGNQLRRHLEEERQRDLAAGSSDPEFYEGAAATQRLFLVALREAGAEPAGSVGHVAIAPEQERGEPWP